MLACHLQSQSGYTILEALIATSMVTIVSVGLWQLVAATRARAHTSFAITQPQCDTPLCSATSNGATCVCGLETYFAIR